jgi:hypothetical protein
MYVNEMMHQDLVGSLQDYERFLNGKILVQADSEVKRLIGKLYGALDRVLDSKEARTALWLKWINNDWEFEQSGLFDLYAADGEIDDLLDHPIIGEHAREEKECREEQAEKEARRRELERIAETNGLYVRNVRRNGKIAYPNDLQGSVVTPCQATDEGAYPDLKRAATLITPSRTEVSNGSKIQTA